MTDASNGTQTSIYRCMNKDVVNSNFDLEIDYFKVSMRCVVQPSSGATGIKAWTRYGLGIMAAVTLLFHF